MARRAARWVWDHKRLVVGTSLAAAGAYTGYVLWQKKLELDALCEELMGTQAAPVARNEESRAREHFDVTQQEARAVLGREMPRMHAQLKRLLDTEALTLELRSGKKFDQVQWNGLKLMMWTRLLSSVYALALLELKLRIHINIVARHYLHETSAAAAGGSGGGGGGSGELSKVTKLRFLSSESLCADGFEPLVRAVRVAVETELAGISLDQKLTTEQLAGEGGEPNHRTAAPPHLAPRTSRPACARATHPRRPSDSADVLSSIRTHLESETAAASPDAAASASTVRRRPVPIAPPRADSPASLRAYGSARSPPDVPSRAAPSLPPSFPARGAPPLPHQVRAFLLEGLEDLEAHETHGGGGEAEQSQLGVLHAEVREVLPSAACTRDDTPQYRATPPYRTTPPDQVREILQSAPYHVMLADAPQPG